MRSGDGSHRLTVAGELDLASSSQLIVAGLEALDSHACTELQLDLSRVSFIDSTGIGALVQLKNAADDSGHRLVLIDPAPRVVEVLELSGMAGVFQIEVAPTRNEQMPDPLRP